MTAGSKRGERRGGRKKGTPNRATVERHLEILKAAGVDNYSARLGRDVLAKVMDELDALAEKYHPARGPESDEDRFVKYALMSAKVAGNLTPYQSPALASIHAGVSKQSALERPGTVEREVYAEFMAEIAQSGELPRHVKTLSHQRWWIKRRRHRQERRRGKSATLIDKVDYPQSPQKFPGRITMRAGLLIATALVQTSVAYAAEPMAPNDIKATFFNGNPFDAVSPSGTKFTMTFAPSGKMTRQALAPPGKTNVGIWKLNAKGFCTGWEHAGSNCFTVVPSGDNKWLVQRTATTITTTIAVWSK